MPRRRELLKAGAVAVALGTAGCNRSGTEDDDPGATGNASSDDGGDEDRSDGDEGRPDGDGSEEGESIEGWPSFQRTARNDGRAAGLSLSADPTERFRVSLPAGIEHQPVVSGDLLYAHLADGTLSARDTATGEERWSRSVAETGTTPCVVDDVVLTTTATGIRGFDRATGDPRWEADVTGVSTPPTPVGERVYTGTDSGDLVVLDPTEPAVLDRIEVGRAVRTAPAVLDDRVFVGVSAGERGGEFVAVDREGAVDWRADVYRPEAVVATAERVIGVNYGGFVLYTPGGQKRGSGTASAVPAVDEGAIYTGSEVVTPLPRRRSGTGWTFWPEDPDRIAEVVGPMSVCAGTLCVPWGYEDDEGDWRRKLLGLDVETGEKRWERRLPGDPTGAVLADGAAFVGTADGELIAFE